MRRNVKYIIIISILIILSLILIFLNVVYKERITIEENSKVEITNLVTKENISVNKDVIYIINDLCKTLAVKYDYVYENPILILTITNSNNKKEIFSVFNNGYIYRGYFLDAWYDRMHDKKSKLIIMNYRLGQLLFELSS